MLVSEVLASIPGHVDDQDPFYPQRSGGCLWSVPPLNVVHDVHVLCFCWTPCCFCGPAMARGHVDVSGLCFHWRPCGWPLLLSEPMLISVACVASRSVTVAETPVDAQGLYCYWRPFWGPWSILLAETMWKSMICATSDCKEQGRFFSSSMDKCRLTVKKERLRSFCDNLPYYTLLPKETV